jgi:hypothetical protein
MEKSRTPEKLQAAATNAATACCSPQNRCQHRRISADGKMFFHESQEPRVKLVTRSQNSLAAKGGGPTDV